LEGISQSRNYKEESVDLNEFSEIGNYQEADRRLQSSPWKKRGRKFQEHVLSSRNFVFVDDTVFWKCPTGFWESLFVRITRSHAIAA
jgi:hypothetical protein